MTASCKSTLGMRLRRMGRKAAATALAFALAAAGVPAQALEAVGGPVESEPAPVRCCLLVVTHNLCDIAEEPVLESLGDAHLLCYPSEAEAEAARARLTASGLQVEADRILSEGDAVGIPWDAYAPGRDPFSAALAGADAWGEGAAAGNASGTPPRASLCGYREGMPQGAGAIRLLHPDKGATLRDGDAPEAPEGADASQGLSIYALDDGATTSASILAALYVARGAGVREIALPRFAMDAESALVRDALEDARGSGVVFTYADDEAVIGKSADEVVPFDGANEQVEEATAPETEANEPEAAQDTQDGTQGGSQDPERMAGVDEFSDADSEKDAEAAAAPQAAPAKPNAAARARVAKAAAQSGTISRSMSVSMKKTELRSKLKWGGHHADRSSSAVPANEVVLDAGSTLPLKSAKLECSGFKKGKPVKAKRKMNESDGVNTERYGVWLPFDASYVKGKEVKVPGTLKLTWSNVGADADGNRLDLVLTATDIRLKTNDAATKKSNSVCLFRNTQASGEKGKLTASARMQSVSGQNMRCGVSMEITCHLYVSGTKNDTASRYVMKITDIDQPDRTESASGTFAKTADYLEGIQLVDGFEGKAYLQQDISRVERNGEDHWTNPGKESDGSATWGKSGLRVDKSTAHFRATSATHASGVDHYASYYRSGLAVRTSGRQPFSFRWHGSKCDTFLFTAYEGVTIRDKNDPTKKGVSDQGIIRKNVNNDGQRYATAKAADATRRTGTSWRSTDMPWKGAATYTFSAKPGYRVTKVTVKGHEGNTVKVPTVTYTKGAQLKSLTFAGTKPSGGYATVMDYDIVVTTAKVADAKATISARKTLSGATLAANQFTFGLYASKGASKALATAKNDASGNIRFSGISELAYAYDDAASYPLKKTYYLHEVPGKASGVSYDDTWWQATVTVDYSSSYAPSVSVSYKNLSSGASASTPVFANKKVQYAGVKVKKVDANGGAPLSGARFSVYRGSHATAAAAKSSGNPVATMTSGSDGIATVAATKLSLGSYTVVETAAPSGYHLGGESGSSISTQWCRRFTLSTAGQVLDLTGDPCKNDRKSTTTAWWPPKVRKAVEGRGLEGGEYTFRLVNPETGAVLQTARNDEHGDVAFDEIGFGTGMRNRVYHYVIEEVDGGDAQTSYDKSWWQVDVVRYVNSAYSDPQHRVSAVYTKHAAGDAKPTKFYDTCYSTTAVPTAASSANKLTIVYHANGATGIDGGTAGLTKLEDPIEPAGTYVYAYAGQNFRDAGVFNYSGTGGAYNLVRPGYIPTLFWRVGDPNGSIRIHQDESLDGVKAAAAAMGVDLSKKSATVHLYAEWVPDDGAHGVWQTNMYGGVYQHRDAARALFTNSFEARSGASARKADAETGEGLAGAAFEIRGAEDGAALYDVDGTTVDSLRIVTGGDGIASTHDKALVSGKRYRICEASAPTRYAVDHASWHEFIAGVSNRGQVAYESPDAAPEGRAYAVFDPAKKTLSFIRSNEEHANASTASVKSISGETFSGTVYTGHEESSPDDRQYIVGETYTTHPEQIPWDSVRDQVEHVVFVDAVRPLQTAWWFADMPALADVGGLERLDTSRVTSMQAMFRDDASLAELDVSSFDTSAVVSFGSMFCGTGLTSVDVSGFETASCRDVGWMFKSMSNLESADVSWLGDSGAALLNEMFRDAASLATVTSTPYADFSGAERGTNVFSGCTSLHGGAGTAYTVGKVDKSLARADGLGAKPGYFTPRSDLDGQTTMLGTWLDSPAGCSATIRVEKEYLLKTGRDSYQDLDGVEQAFAFELHEGQADGPLLQTLNVPVQGGAGAASFAPIPYSAEDIGSHTYTVVEAAPDDPRIETQQASVGFVVDVALREGGDYGLVASIDGQTPAHDAQGSIAFTNTYAPGFDIRILKQDQAENTPGKHEPLKGAVFEVFEIGGLGGGPQPVLPTLFTDASRFDAVFKVSDDGRTLSYDADEAAAGGAVPVASIASDANGLATTEGRLLDAGKAYAVVETSAPAGYTLQLAHPTVYILDDLAPDGSFAHMAYPDAEAPDGIAFEDKDSLGNDIARTDAHATRAYRISVGSHDDAVADSEMVFQNARSDEPMGGLGVRKVDAETGEGVSGAEFWAWEEGAFADTYRRFRADNPESPNSEFLAMLVGAYAPVDDEGDVDDGDGADATRAEGEGETGNPYLLEPAIMLEPTDGQGYAASTPTELKPGTYRIVEVHPPRSYDPPAYDFAAADGGTSGNITIEVTRDKLAMADKPISNTYHPMEASAPISATKNLEGTTLREGQFQFRLYDASDDGFGHALLATENAADGTIDLGTISYSTDNGGTLSLQGSDGHVYHEQAGVGAVESFRYQLVECVPEGATASIDGKMWTFGEYAARNGRAAAGDDGPWTYDGVDYDATVKTLVVEVEENDDTLRLSASWEGGEAVFENEVPRDYEGAGGLLVKKVDQDGHPLEGAEFTVSGTRSDTGARHIATIGTDWDGIAQIAPDGLPLGSYTIRESKAPDGFSRDTAWEKTFVIAEDGQVADYSLAEADWCVNRKSPIVLPVTGFGGVSCLTLLCCALLCTSLLLRSRAVTEAGGA